MANQPKKYKKFVATAATATLVASAIVPVASAASFSDVIDTNSHKGAIEALSEAGIIKGYADGTFKPGKDLTRSDVVKLLGKYLETQGFEAPADYNTVSRFSDVNLKNDELAKYAAIVADAGVFAGSNGKLLAGEPITRENMAIVLVRMVNTLKDVSLEEFVATQDFTKEVKDINSAKAEARTAIDVLDFYDITTVANFLPKNTVTRGQFATFLNNVINADFTGAAVTGTVKAINNTTVEIKFSSPVGTVVASDFTIAGLDVKNAAVKQSDANTVVLTTVAQEVGKEYTVSYKGEEVGKFVGVEAVIPTSVNIVEKSLQAPVGTQVTLKAQVTVAEGKSKAGIPVTFNIVNNASIQTATLNQPIVAEAVTDENGVATYTYTRYAQTSYQIASHDEVQAYATGDATKRSFSKVYWANIQPLAITEVTAGNAIQNGAKKVYKVKVAQEHAEKVTNAAGTVTGYKVNVGFRENVNVTPDAAVKTVDVIDSKGQNLSYPGQFTSSTAGANNLNNWVKEVELVLDANGEAIFTLSGNNAAVTPFVFVDQKVNPSNAAGTDGRFEETELFADAPKVTFAKEQTLGLTLESVGVQYAASFLDTDAGDNNRLANSLETIAVDGSKTFAASALRTALINTGGRDYKGVLTDKNGKTAPAGTPVKAQIKLGSALKTNGGAVYLVDNNTNTVHKLTNDASTPVSGTTKTVELKADSKGAVSFTLIGYKDAYATPTVFVESGDKPGLDTNDLQQAGEIVYFSDAVVKTASLTVSDKSVTATEEVEYTYATVDQNGKAYRPADANYLVTFQVSTTFNPVNVKPGQGTGFVINTNTNGSYNFNGNTVLVGQGSTGQYDYSRNNYETVVMQTDAQGVASILVSSANGLATNVDVIGSASIASLPQNLTASNEFTTYATKDLHAKVVSYNGTANTVYVTDVNGKGFTYSYTGATIQINGTNAVSEQAFETALATAAASEGKQSLSIKLIDGVYVFNVLTNTPAPTVSGTIPSNENVLLSVDGKTATLTFDKNIVASSVQNDDFVVGSSATAFAGVRLASTGSVAVNTATVTGAEVTGNQIKLTFSGALTSGDTVTVKENSIQFTDGTLNVGKTFKLFTNTNIVSEISTLTPNKSNTVATTTVDSATAVGSVKVGEKTLTATVTTAASATVTAYNGLKFVFVKNTDTTVSGVRAEYNSATRTVTVKIGYASTENTIANVKTAINGLANHGEVVFANIDLSGDVFTQDQLTNSATISLAGGVVGKPATTAQSGEYSFTLNTNLKLGDKVTLNGYTYVAGSNFAVGTTPAATATELAKAIQLTDARFAMATASGATITLTDKVINGDKAPELKLN